MWQNHGELTFKGGGSGSLIISAGAYAASAAIRVSLGDIDGSNSGLVYGTKIPYGTSRFLGIKIDNVAGGGNETFTVIKTPDLTTPNWGAPDMADGPLINIGTPTKLYLEAQTKTYSGTAYGAMFDEIRIGLSWADVAPIPLPEPATLPVLGIGCALALLRRSRRRKLANVEG